jgi:hypothetical protein
MLAALGREARNAIIMYRAGVKDVDCKKLL